MAEVPRRLIIFESEYWTLNHRIDCALPGYLMLGARAPVSELASLPEKALEELGSRLAAAQRALTAILRPDHFYVGRFGHSAGYSIHFHLIPICGWVKERFRADARYDAVRRLGPRSDPEETDGAEMTLYVWREFCESENPPEVVGLSIEDVVTRLRQLLAA
jgi:diadenosine tetraphosphate (Ap4A) HIT family hydrolase